MNHEEAVHTGRGPGRAVYFLANLPQGVVLLSHGAGNGIESPDLQALAAALPSAGWSVVLFEQPWRVAGRKVATAPLTLDEGLVAASRAVRTSQRLDPSLPMVVGGRSAGARSALRCAASVGASGALCLAFPLHPPGRPERTRLPELQGAGVPVLLLQGERDSMGRPGEFPNPLPLGVQLVGVPSADHSLRVPKRGEISQEATFALIVDETLQWLSQLVTSPDGNHL